MPADASRPPLAAPADDAGVAAATGPPGPDGVGHSADEIAAWLDADASDLPALPVVAAELMTLAHDPDTAYERLAEIVVREPVLAARILRLVNSAYFGLSRKVTDIRHAVFLLGFRTVRTVALTAAVLVAFKDTKAGHFDLRRYWQHSISTAAVCRTLAARCGAADAETAFSLGLLHDIGKLLLARYRSEDMKNVITNAEEKGLSFIESEQEIVPIAHPQLGAWFARRWNLPAVLVDGIAWHHVTPEGEFRPLHAAVQFANYLCAIKGLATSGSCGTAALRREVWTTLGLATSDLPSLIEVINEEIKTGESLLAHA